jgi:hypothetical protein
MGALQDMTMRLSRKKPPTLQAKWTTSLLCGAVTQPLEKSLDSLPRSSALRYTHITDLTWIQEVKPASYNPAITNATATHTQKCADEEWEEKYKSWYIHKGSLHRTTMNMHEAHDEQYYSQLKHLNTA